jgi:hypothetical protein
VKTTLVLTVDLPPRDVLANIAALTRCITWYPMPAQDGDTVSGAVEFCCLGFGQYTMRVDL